MFGKKGHVQLVISMVKMIDVMTEHDKNIASLYLYSATPDVGVSRYKTFRIKVRDTYFSNQALSQLTIPIPDPPPLTSELHMYYLLPHRLPSFNRTIIRKKPDRKKFYRNDLLQK